MSHPANNISLQKNSITTIEACIKGAQNNLLNHQHKDGYWWYTLEANDSINAEFIMLLRYLGIDDKQTEQGLCRWMLSNQNEDGSWSLYYRAAGDISSTVECYFALKIAGFDTNHPQMVKAREFILNAGGITKIRVFSRIHLALFGLVDWKIVPNMPVALIQFPEWAPVNIYEFSSWARACIVPLLVIMDQKKTIKIPDITLDELYLDSHPKKAKWDISHEAGMLSMENMFVQIDKALHVADKLKFKPLRKLSLKKCEKYIREHLSYTEDIYPAMFYGVLALNSLGHGLDDINVEKALIGLRSFQIIMSHKELHQIPFQDSATIDYNVLRKNQNDQSDHVIYQQCCISPIWDTAWAAVALADSGFPVDDDRMTLTAQWLLSKQITDLVGDWGVKNPDAQPGGWSFEFVNKYYPDVDDTIEVLTFLHQSSLPYRVLKSPIERGLKWLLSMQCKNGGFAAFDKDNSLILLNKIPFSDHGACLDPATVDITGRVIEFLLTTCDYEKDNIIIQRAADFIVARQEKDGSFWGRWGVNYIYGTWCALEGLCPLNRRKDELTINRAVHWLKDIQNPDGGFSESSESYRLDHYLPLEESVPSQTAWALMGLVAAGQANSDEAQKAAQYLIDKQNSSGGWDEEYYTGTGFPGHFYIRYHGYRHYFPLLALAKYNKAL
ncbi:MAG: terpene cyclase/mutase family protein [bacterium]|nr:terpene cyclase/mutase family protein [bacterium]MBU1917996.1 terpene cyclase/mutase family protein [bacterium]